MLTSPRCEQAVFKFWFSFFRDFWKFNQIMLAFSIIKITFWQLRLHIPSRTDGGARSIQTWQTCQFSFDDHKMISEPSLVLNKHKYEWFYYNSCHIIWRPDGLFIELLQICDLQLIVVVYWLLERILRICLIFTSVVFYSYEPDHISANSPMNLLFPKLRTLSLISLGRVSCLKVLTSYSCSKSFYILAKGLVKHEWILVFL